jgi:hypothetical protein
MVRCGLALKGMGKSLVSIIPSRFRYFPENTVKD